MEHGSLLHVSHRLCCFTVNCPARIVGSGRSTTISAEGAPHLSLILWRFRVFIRLISTAIAICSYSSRHRRWSCAFCQCLGIITPRMPATKHDCLWQERLGIHSAATGFPGLWNEKVNVCAENSLEETFQALKSFLINCCFLCPTIRISSIVILKSNVILNSNAISLHWDCPNWFLVFVSFTFAWRSELLKENLHRHLWSGPKMKSTFCFVLWRGSGATLELDCLDHSPIAIYWCCDYSLSGTLSSCKQWGQ